MWITTNLMMWIAPMRGDNVNYHKYDNHTIIIIMNMMINYYYLIIINNINFLVIIINKINYYNHN